MPPDDFNPLGLLGVGAPCGVPRSPPRIRQDLVGCMDSDRPRVGGSAARRPNAAASWCLLSHEFGTASTFVVKDPRMCRIVPFWLRHLQANGTEPRRSWPFGIRSTSHRHLPPGTVCAAVRAADVAASHARCRAIHPRPIPESSSSTRDLLPDWRRTARQMAKQRASNGPACPTSADSAITHSSGETCAITPPQRSDAAWNSRLRVGCGAPGRHSPSLRQPGHRSDHAEAWTSLDDVGAQLDRAGNASGGRTRGEGWPSRRARRGPRAERVGLLHHATALEADRNALRGSRRSARGGPGSVS